MKSIDLLRYWLKIELYFQITEFTRNYSRYTKVGFLVNLRRCNNVNTYWRHRNIWVQNIKLHMVLYQLLFLNGTYCSTTSNVLVYKSIQYIPLKVHKSMISSGLKLKYSSFPSIIKTFLLILTKALYNCTNNLAKQRMLSRMKKLTF